MSEVETRVCRECGKRKSITEYHKKLDGTQPNCKECVRAYQRERRQEHPDHVKAINAKSYEKHRERRREYHRERHRQHREWLNRQRRERYRNDPDYRERAKAYAKYWSHENRERRKELSRRWVERNREHVRRKNREFRKKYFAQRPQYFRSLWAIYSANRRAMLGGATGEITRLEWDAIQQKYDYTCLGCGKREPEIKLSIDHIVPISMGGENTPDNIQPLCITCNCKKYRKAIDYRPGKEE